MRWGPVGGGKGRDYRIEKAGCSIVVTADFIRWRVSPKSPALGVLEYIYNVHLWNSFRRIDGTSRFEVSVNESISSGYLTKTSAFHVDRILCTSRSSRYAVPDDHHAFATVQAVSAS
jgi:hypothetical protein